MNEKKIVYMVFMGSDDEDYGYQYEIEIFAKKEDAMAYWKQHVETELHDSNMSWVADAYEEGNFDRKRYELTHTETYFSFEEIGWNKYVAWYVEEKEVR